MDNFDGQLNTGAAEAAITSYVDQDWAEQYAGAEQAGEDAPKISGQTVPTSPFYHVRGFLGKGGQTKKAKLAVARVGVEILNGPAGTVGERVFDDLFLTVKRTTNESGVEVPKDEDTYEEQRQRLFKTLNKIARVGKFGRTFPVGPSVEAIDAYAKQFEQGFEGIIEIRESTDEYEGVKRLRNRLVFESLRALDDPAVSKKAKPGTTAKDEAYEKIAEADKVAAAKAGGAGRTAGSVVRKPGGLGD